MSISFAATPQAKEGQQTRAYTDDVSAGAPPSRRTGYDRPYVNRDHWNKVFTQPEYFDSIAKQKGMVEGAKVSLHGDDYVYRQAMMGYLSATRNVPLDDMRSVFDAEKDGFAQKVLGKKTATARELFDWHKTKFERENEKNDAARTVIEDVIKTSLQDSLSGSDTPFVESVAKSIEATGDLFTEEEKSRLWEKAEEQDKQIRATQAAIAPEARFLFSALGQISGQQAGMGAPDMREVAGKFAQLPDNQRKAIYELVGGFAQLQQVDKGFWYQMAESLGRGTSDIIERVPRNFREQTLRGQLRLLESEQPVFRATGVAGAEFSAAGSTPATPEEREQAKAKIQSDLGILKVEREIRDLAERVVDPIKTVTFLPEIVEEGLYSAAQSIPYTVAAAVPYAGIPAVASALFSANYDRIMLEYPDLDPDKAALIAAASAPIEAVLERMKVRTITGRLPVFGGLVNRLQHPNQRNLTRIMIGAGGVLAEQNLQEIVQGLTFPVVQTIAAAIDQDMRQGLDVEKTSFEIIGRRLENYPRELAVQFVALLPLSLMGIGALSHREMTRGADYIRNKSNLERMGYGEDQIDRITGAATADEAQTILQEESGKRDPEAVKAAAQRVLDEVLALREQKAPASLPRLEKQGADYVVLQPDGTVITRSTDQTVAEQALVSARRETVQREMRDVYTGINEAVEFIQKVNEARQRGEDIAKVIRESAPRTLLTDYEANPTQENLDRLFETVRAFGQDINEPAELANFPVTGSNQGALAEGIWRSVIRINEGADGTIVMREFAQDNLKRAISEGRVTMDFVRQQLNDVLPQIDSSRIKRQLRTETDTDVIEAFSDVAVAYFRGSIREEQIPAGLRGIMRRLAIISRDIFRRAYNLARLRAEGKLDRDFEALLAEAVGVNQQALVDRSRERTEQELGAAENYSIGISPAMDTDYLAAVERGDMEMAQRMVDEAARAAGYTIKGFHGTGSQQEFDVFDDTVASPNIDTATRLAITPTGEGWNPEGIHIGTEEQARTVLEFRGVAEGKGRLIALFAKASYTKRVKDGNAWRPVIVKAKKEGYDSLVYKNVFEGKGDSYVLFYDYQVKKADPVTYDASGNVIPLSQRFDATTADINYSIGLRPDVISQVSDRDDGSRVGTAKLGTDKVPVDTPQTSNISGDTVPEDLLAKQMAKVDYAHLPDSIRNESDPKKKRRKLINWFKKNLLALHDAFPEEVRARATHWYDGANRIAREFGQRFNATVEQASGVIAVFSPQKDWFMNVAQAMQFMELWTTSQDVALSEETVRAEVEDIIEAATAPQRQKRKKAPDETKEQAAERKAHNQQLDQKAKDERRTTLDKIIGKTVRELDDQPYLQGWAIRVLAQVTFGRNYRNISPEGEMLGMATNDDGALAKNGWGSINEIKKAVRIMKDGALANISNNLGNEHKVRNFYNNIVAPNSGFGDATIDTHAVAAAHLMPYGAKATEVQHNFGSGMNSSDAMGVSGLYHVYLDAYREAAKERGLQPRQLQSITWEAIRLVYPAANKNAATLAKAAQTWNSLSDGRARNSLVGGTIPNPVWAGTGNVAESQSLAGATEGDGQGSDAGRGLRAGDRSDGRQGVSNYSILARYEGTPSVAVEGGRPYSPIVRDLLQRRAAGEDIPREVIDQAINENFPAQLVEVPRSVAELPDRAVINDAIDKGQRDKRIDVSTIEAGEKVAIRQDVPAMTRKGVGVVTVKSKAGNSYEAAVRITEPDFILNEKKSLRIAMGEAKGPHIVINGKWAADQSMPSDLETWTQVGYNPDRHSFYYDRATMQQVTGGSEAYQIGNTVFIKDAQYGDGQISDISYSISTQSEIDRVQKAMDRLARSPSERISQYAALKERLAAALERNQPIMQSMRGDTLPQDFDRTRILNDLGFLDYILKVLPPEVRGRVGGYTNLAAIAPVDVYKGDQKVSEAKNPAGAIISAWMREGQNIGQAQKNTALPEGYSTVANTTDERRDKTVANFLIDRLKKIDRELERYYKRDLMERIFDVLDKSRPKAGQSGVKRSTLGAETQKFADMVYRSSLLDDEKTAERLTAIEAQITGIQPRDSSPEAFAESQKRISELSEEWTIVNTFGDLKSRPSETLAYGLEWLQGQLKAGRSAWQIKEAARIQENRERAAKVVAFLGKPTDVGRFENKSTLQRFLEAVNAYDLDHKSFEQFAPYLFGDEVAAELSKKMQRAQINEAKAELENMRSILAAIRQGAKAAGMSTGKALVAFKENQSKAVRKLEGRRVKDTKISIELAKKIVRGLADRGSLSQADVQTLADELAALPRDTKKEFVTIKQVIFRGEEVRLTMSRAQAMQLWLTWQQRDAQEKMRADGFNDDSFDDLDNLISGPFAQAILRVTSRIYGSGYALTNPIYARMFGMNMPMVKNYAPARYQSNKEVKDVGLDGSPLTAGGQPSFAKSRVNHTAKLAPEDALTVLQSHIAMQSHWVAFAEVTREYRSLLSNPDVRESIRQRLGKDVLRSADMWGDQMEQRGGNKGREIAWINNMLGAVIGGQSVSLLGFNLKSLMMQTDNFMRFFLALDSRQIGSALSDPVALMQSVRKVWKTDIIQTRLEGGATAETRFFFERFVSMFRRGAKVAEMSMMPMNYLDSAGLSISGAVVYQAAYKDALDSGVDPTSAEQVAKDAVEAMIYRYGQPVLMGQKSNIENSGNAFTKAFFLFMSDPRLKMAIISDSVRGLATGRGDWKAHVRRIVAIEMMAVVAHVLATAFRDATSDDDDEDLWSVGGFARALLLAPFQGYFLMGSVSDLVLSRLTEAKWFTPTQNPLIRTADTAMRAFNNIDDAFNFDDPDALVKEWTDITRSLAVAPPLAAPAVILNLVRPLVQAWERMDDDE